MGWTKSKHLTSWIWLYWWTTIVITLTTDSGLRISGYQRVRFQDKHIGARAGSRDIGFASLGHELIGFQDNLVRLSNLICLCFRKQLGELDYWTIMLERLLGERVWNSINPFAGHRCVTNELIMELLVTDHQAGDRGTLMDICGD